MKKLIVVGILVCAGALCGWYYFTGTPTYSLMKLGDAIKSRDYETARTFVDEDRLADQVAADATETIFSAVLQDQEKASAGNPFAGFGSALMSMLKPQVTAVAKAQVRQTINDLLGAHSSLNTRDATARHMDETQFRSIHLASIYVSGNTAEATFDHLPPDSPAGLRTFRVRLAHQEATRTWKVVAMPDISAVFAAPVQAAIAKQ